MTKPLPKGNPAFCFIAPTAFVEPYVIPHNTHRHLVLAHIALNDPAYTATYRHLSQMGDFIICDNGAFELGASFTPDKLIELGTAIGADALVLPDYPGQPGEKTVQAAQQWIPKFKSAGFRTMFVPQSQVGDLEDWIASYRWAAMNPDIDIIGMSILGIPNALPHIPACYARVVMTEILRARNGFAAAKYHHYLGLNSGPKLEIPPLLKMNALDSIDSSGPIWAAINGQQYNIHTDSYMMYAKNILPHVDFAYKTGIDPAGEALINNNIALTLELFK
jgi:hypothetical protein